MPFDAVTLNDGTRVRLLPPTPRPVCYREPTVSDPCVWDWIQMETDCKPENSLVALLLTICRPCGLRTLVNMWPRPLRQASSTLTQLPVMHFQITSISHWTQPQSSAYRNERSVGTALKHSGLARSPVLSSACFTGLTVRKQIRFVHHYEIFYGGCTQISYNKFERGILSLYNTDRLLADILQARIEEIRLVSRP